MAPWLPPIVVYCPPAQQCSAVAPPAPPAAPRPVVPPPACAPFSPRPSSPRFPATGLWGRRGGVTGGALWVPCSWAGGGGASVACVMGPPTCAILGRVSRLELARPCAPLARRSWHRAGKTRPGAHQRDGMPPRSVRAELLVRPFATNGQQYSGTPGNGIPACASSTGVRAGAPRAAHSFAAFPALHRPAAAVA